MDLQQRTLNRYITLSIAAAIATIGLKSLAALLTGSVGFLSDAMESGVNLVAAVVALWALRVSARRPDVDHHFGHGNAEYLSAAVEGALIFVAAIAIVWTAIQRLLDPQPLEQAGVGLALSTGASLINLAVGLALVRVGRAHRSMVLVADGKHLLTDVVTSAGVLVGIALVAIFEWEVLDPIVALLVGVNILVTGYGLVRRSVVGLLDASLPPDDVAAVEAVLARYRAEHGIEFHAVRTRESGRKRFVYLDVLVPDDWTVTRAHRISDQLERDMASALVDTVTFTHIEPIGDPASYDHADLPRPATKPET